MCSQLVTQRDLCSQLFATHHLPRVCSVAQCVASNYKNQLNMKHQMNIENFADFDAEAVG